MSISHWNECILIHMITMNSALTINKTGSSIIDDDEENRREKTSRPVTFTLGPSSSSLASISSLNLQQDLHHNKSLAQLPNDNIKYSRHSQSETIDIQRRRPIIEDPYRLSPNLQILNDWMIVSWSIFHSIKLIIDSQNLPTDYSIIQNWINYWIITINQMCVFPFELTMTCWLHIFKAE